MTTVLVLGGSGRTGIHVLRQAAERGHRVRALVRRPDALEVPAGVELIAGTPSDIDDLRRASDGAEAIVSALNNSRATDNPWAEHDSPPNFMTDAMRDTLTVMKERGIRRLAVASTIGAGDSWPILNPIFKALIRISGIRRAYDDHHGVDALLRASMSSGSWPARSSCPMRRRRDRSVPPWSEARSPARPSAAATSPASSSTRWRTTPGCANRR